MIVADRDSSLLISGFAAHLAPVTQPFDVDDERDRSVAHQRASGDGDCH